jgi:hypothetical protein
MILSATLQRCSGRACRQRGGCHRRGAAWPCLVCRGRSRSRSGRRRGMYVLHTAVPRRVGIVCVWEKVGDGQHWAPLTRRPRTRTHLVAWLIMMAARPFWAFQRASHSCQHWGHSWGPWGGLVAVLSLLSLLLLLF